MRKNLFVQLIRASILGPAVQKSKVPSPALGCRPSPGLASSLGHLFAVRPSLACEAQK